MFLRPAAEQSVRARRAFPPPARAPGARRRRRPPPRLRAAATLRFPCAMCHACSFATPLKGALGFYLSEEFRRVQDDARDSVQPGPVVGQDDRIARIGGIVLDAGRPSGDQSLLVGAALQARDVLRRLVAYAGDRIAVADQLAEAVRRTRPSCRAETAPRRAPRLLLAALPALPGSVLLRCVPPG